MATLADALRSSVFPGQRCLVPADPAASPEVGSVVGGDLLHEVVSLGGGVKGHHPHASAGAILSGSSPGEGVTALSSTQRD